MSEGEVARHVHVRRGDTGEPIDAAFLPMEPELWDRERRRVTILFDPARIKRGLAPNRAIGYPLTEGVAVDVVVDAGFLDGDGHPLAAGRDASLRHRPGRPAPGRPRRVAPRGPGGRDADPAGRHLRPSPRPRAPPALPRCRHRRGPRGRGRRDRGRRARRRGRSLRTRPWAAGAYELTVDGILEDLAGNSVCASSTVSSTAPTTRRHRAPGSPGRSPSPDDSGAGYPKG